VKIVIKAGLETTCDWIDILC